MGKVYNLSWREQGGRDNFAFLGPKKAGGFIFSFFLSVSFSRYKYLAQTLRREVKNFPQFMIFSAPSFVISFHWVFCELRFGNNWACIRQDGGNLELKLEIWHFSLPYPRNGENHFPIGNL